MTGESGALADLRRHLERVEADLRGQGYRVDRCVGPPGARLDHQFLDEEVLLLVLLGGLTVESNDERLELGAGDQLRIPAGVPFVLETPTDAHVYWIQARRNEAPKGMKTDPGEEGS